MWTCRQIPTLWRNILPPLSALKREGLCSSETMVSTYKSKWHYNPEDQYGHLHCHENLKSNKNIICGFSNSSFSLFYILNHNN
jgi:hypothetical protein